MNQTYTNLEIILIDDGSPDNCPQTCDEWAKKDSRIKVIHKENGGNIFLMLNFRKCLLKVRQGIFLELYSPNFILI